MKALVTDTLAAGHEAVMAFVNDGLDAAALRILARGGVRLVALRCAGHNNLDLAAAATLGIQAVSLPSDTPNAVAEHVFALPLSIVVELGRIGRAVACPDVYEEEAGVFYQDLSNEILEDDALARLLTFPNVLITSHMGFLTREALREIADATIASLTAFEAGKPLYHALALH